MTPRRSVVEVVERSKARNLGMAGPSRERRAARWGGQAVERSTFWVWRRTTGGRSATVAGLYALHALVGQTVRRWKPRRGRSVDGTLNVAR